MRHTHTHSSSASWHFQQLSVDPQKWGVTDRREGRTLGGVRSQWVEEGGVWSSGWMGGVSGKAVKNAESAGELVTKAGRGQQARNADQEKTMTTDSPATRPFIDPMLWAGVTTRSGVVTRIGRSGWAPASTRAGRHDRKRPHCTSGQMVTSGGVVSLRAP